MIEEETQYEDASVESDTSERAGACADTTEGLSQIRHGIRVETVKDYFRIRLD